jgi:two-component system chemotaxis sensor kinase CheA
MNVLDVSMATFREEAAERLAEAESSLLELKGAPESAELVDCIFRALHTVKGASAMVGLEAISTLAHDIEAVFAKIREGRLAAETDVVNLSLAGLDVIRAMVADPTLALSPAEQATLGELRALGGRDEAKPEGTATAGAIVFFPDDPSSATEGAEATVSSSLQGSPEPETYRIRFRPRANLLKEGGDLRQVFAELAALGSCELVADVSAIPALETMDPGACYVAWDMLVTTNRGADAVRDVFLLVEEGAELRIEPLDLTDAAASGGPKRFGEILLERGDLTTGQLNEALASKKRIGDVLLEKGYVTPAAVKAAALEQKVRRAQAESRAAAAPASATVRVAAERLDELVDLVGELVIAQARLVQIAAHRDDPELATVAEDLARLSSELRDSTLSVRMVPIGTTFSRFNRLVHDLAGELGKDIELETRGAETELDKTVIERLTDPLMHLIRNSCDHGIEAPAVRVAAGKPARATVTLSAYHAGRHVVVEIRDDGAGLDLEAIRARAIEKNLIDPGAVLSESEITGLIFLPGFSTAKVVSNVSGRGVGMDVVKRSIEALRGTVEIESQRGQGTCIRITLPLTLAIIEGLLVRVGTASYVLPMSLVEECVELTRADVARANGNRVTPVRGELVPYLRLRDWFQVEGDGPAIEQITIVTAGGFRCGLVVDHVVGQHQTVIKSLGNMYAGVKGISGATILGNGDVALIVDVPILLRAATHQGQGIDATSRTEWS